MKKVLRASMIAAGLLSLVGGVVLAKELQSALARKKIAGVLGFDKVDRVHIKNISVSGGEAVVEADFTAAFRFSVDKNGDWVPVEVRTGDRQWESLELIQTAITKEKALRTAADLRTLAAALEAYRRERGSYVNATSGATLMDQLAPAYLRSVMRLDAWSREFYYNGGGLHYRLTSSGPDGKSGTDDDIVMEDGQLVKGARE